LQGSDQLRCRSNQGLPVASDESDVAKYKLVGRIGGQGIITCSHGNVCGKLTVVLNCVNWAYVKLCEAVSPIEVILEGYIDR